MTPDALAALVSASVTDLIEHNKLCLPKGYRVNATVERPKNREHGDYATNVAMTLAKPAHTSPRIIGEMLAAQLSQSPAIARAEVAGPGFVNITLEAASQGEVASRIVIEGAHYGQGTTQHGRWINIEFISANPTGPIHLGHTRWAAVGDAIARVLAAQGAAVTREFYINDRGVQMDRFGESIMNAAHGRPAPEAGYHGSYIKDIAAAIVANDSGITTLPVDEQLVMFRELGYRTMLEAQQESLTRFATHFDVWYSERTLHESGAVERAFAQLRKQGHMYEADGAIWLRTSAFDDDKDRVLVKADGELTYFASDTAYYVDKRSRGADLCIYLLGADHHGYVNRLRAVAACAGDDPDTSIEVLIGQLVKMVKGGEEVRLSKRAGNIITIDDLIDEVGTDAARYSLIRYPVDSPLVLDVDLLLKRTNDNPVYYVQYGSARIASVLRNAEELGIDWRNAKFDPALLANERENDLLGVLAEFPRVVASAAELREPHRIARYLERLATAYHRFYDVCRVLPMGEEPVEPLNIARLWLCAASRQVLVNGLTLLGVSAPERM
ncbi:MAG: arginine--tRNA ligase [Candidatus Nanopelagicales bacterium]|jgi:arginyl-tRNA synthetase|nr:arginine--tRNA ligase [Candidatus Nanopelagicales bacterium]